MKTFKSFIEEGRSKAQQIKGQQAMLDQKIKAEYDKVTKKFLLQVQEEGRKRKLLVLVVLPIKFIGHQ